MMKKVLMIAVMMLLSLTNIAADDTQQFVPSNFGGWQNLSASVNDISYYTNDPLPMQAAVSGSTIHVFWADWKPNAQGEYCVYYRRSADAGKTWEDARAIVASKKLKLVDINYVGGNFGTNAKWFNVEGQNVQVVTIQESDDEKFSELYGTFSKDGGQTFEKRLLAKGGENDHFGRPHVVSNGQTVVIAFQNGRYNGAPYRTRVLTSYDGGQTFTDKEIDIDQKLGDVQVSGKRWAVMGDDDSWNNGMIWGNVYVSTSTDGQTITTQNVAPIVRDSERNLNDYSWGSMEYMRGHNGNSYNYHPQMTLEGDAINVIFRGCAEEVEGTRPTNDRNHTIFRRSTDGGQTWTKAIYLPESNGSYCAIAAKGDHIYVIQAINGPLMTYSHDGGQTWNVQKRCYWEGRYEGFSNFFDLYIAPDDASGQHVYMTGCRALMVESKDGFRTINRNFAVGQESWYGGRSNNHSLMVLVDNEGTEHWVMNYQAPYQSYDPYFWNIVYRRNDPATPTTGKEMALDISKKVYGELSGKILDGVNIPMTPSIMATREATTVECWVRVEEADYSFEVVSMTNDGNTYDGSIYNGGWFIKCDKSGDWYNFHAGLSTEYSVDGTGKRVGDRWRYQFKDLGFWHHVALTYDSKKEKDNIRLYVDGALTGTATESGPIKMGSNPIFIGRTSTYGEKSKILVDNFALWSRALTQEEIQARAYNAPDAKDADCRVLLTFDGSVQDQSQYHNDPAPLMDAILTDHDNIRPPHPEFTMSKEMNGQKVYVNDVTQDGIGCWWILPYPGKMNDYKTSEKRHVEQDFSRDPGTYNYTLIVRGTENCNAFASTSQTIIVGGLSKVFPDASGQLPGVKLRIQGGYKLIYSNKPKVLLKQGDTEIEGEWEVEYGYDNSKVISPDDLAPAVFELWNAPIGKYDVIVGNDTLKQAFTVEQREEPDVWMQVNGFDKMLWNKYQRFTIDYGNRSNAAAYNTPIFLFIPDRKGSVDVEFEFDYDVFIDALDESILPMAQQLGDHLMAYDEQTGDSVRIYSFMIPYIAPNSTNQLAFRVKGKNGVEGMTNNLRIYYWISEPWGPNVDNEEGSAPQRRAGDDEFDEYVNHVNKGKSKVECALTMFGMSFLETGLTAVPVVGCAYNTVKTVTQAFWGKDRRIWAFGTNLITSAFACGTDLFPPSLLVKGGLLFGKLIWDMVSNKAAYDACLKGDPNWKDNLLVYSYDPNEMIGPSGYDDQAHYIKPIHQMPYTVTFENKASATAPAHEVFVNDTLDASKYDLSTFSFTSFGWADTQVAVGGDKTKEFTRDVVYNVKGQDILVRVSGQFDEQTGVARWSFVSLKKNGDEIDDPDLGFLVPNNDNGDGEGFVSFVVEHKANPASGSTVSNKATIVFDANDPIVTNTYVNTFDTDYPTSQIASVEEKDGKLFVTVSGTDATSGIGTYHLYAFKNGGEAELVAVITKGNQASFVCEAGTKYGLCVIATDNVGWTEPKDVKSEMEVTSIKETLTDRSAKGDYIDLQGRRHTEPVSPGIYIQNKKKVYIMKLVQDE